MDAHQHIGLRGKLLVAMPHMDDENFQNSVILVTEHSAEGAMGFVLNDITDSLTFADLLGQLDIQDEAVDTITVPPTESIAMLSNRTAVRAGGPCSQSHGFVVHHTLTGRSVDNPYEGTEVIDERYAFTVSTDVLREIALGIGPKRFLVALGYAGWGPGQLESELRENMWLHSEVTDQLLFEADPETLWESCFAQMGIAPAHVSPVAGRA